jgi:hypothetical protein
MDWAARGNPMALARKAGAIQPVPKPEPAETVLAALPFQMMLRAALGLDRRRTTKEAGMSWNVSVDGTHDEVKEKLGAEQTVPKGITAALDPILEEFAADKAVTVATNGHHDGAGGGYAHLAVTTKA